VTSKKIPLPAPPGAKSQSAPNAVVAGEKPNWVVEGQPGPPPTQNPKTAKELLSIPPEIAPPPAGLTDKPATNVVSLKSSMLTGVPAAAVQAAWFVNGVMTAALAGADHARAASVPIAVAA